MKQIKHLFVALALVASVSSAWADANGTCGTNLTWSYVESTNTLTISGSGAMYDYEYYTSPWSDYRASITSVSLPDGMTHIGNWAFLFCTALTSVDIPAGVTSIGQGAFQQCYGLTSFDIPAGLTSIGEGAIEACTSLTAVTIPASVTSIGDHAFMNCKSLTSIDIPASVTSFGSYAFEMCTSLTTVTFATGSPLTSIPAGTFSQCTSLESITLPASVTIIGNSAFSQSGLTSITLPASVTSIGNSAFSDCTGLSSINIPAGVTSIGNYAFNGCTGLSSITLPAGVTSIGNGAFSECTSLISITIPTGVTSIGDGAFSECTSLTSITIPTGVTSIGYWAFRDCSSLSDVYVNWTDLSGVATDFEVFFGIASPATLHVPYGTKAMYESDEPWNSFTIVELNPSGTCGDNLFWEYNPSTKTLTISGTGAMTDYNNYSSLAPWNTYKNEMTTVVIESGATTVGQYAFYQCTALTSIDIPTGVTTIKQCAFYYCSGLTSINIPAGVTSIDYYAFDSCTGLISINLPNTLTSIYNSAFKNCTALTSITIPANVNYIKSSAFDNCSALTSISVDANNTVYDSRDNCNAIIQTAYKRLLVGCRNTVIPNGVTTIGDEAFYGRTNLSSIEIPNTVKTIGTSTFAYCIDLEFVTIPSSVTGISGYAFAYCTSLKDVYVNWTDLSGVTLFSDIFRDVTLANVNLHLPFEAWGSYNGEPWSGFKQVPMITAKADPDHAGVYYNTFYHGSVAYELPTGVEAYTAKLSGSDLILTKVAQAGQTLPANTAVILKSSVASYEMTPSDATPVTVGENDLQGVDAATAAPSNCYVLSGPNSTNGLTEVGFYTFSGTLGAHKAYLVVPGSSPAPKHLRFVFDATVDIETVTGNPSPVTEKILRDGVLYIQRGEQLYNAQGVRVE